MLQCSMTVPLNQPEWRFIMLTAEQLLTAQKANLAVLFGLSAKAFEGVEKLVELNLQAAKASLGEAAEATKAVLSVKDPQEFVALQSSLLQPNTEKAAAYSRSLYELATATNAEVTKVAEAKLAEAQSQITAAIESAMKNAPAGTEGAATLMKSTLAAASNAYESASKVAKQAASAADANFQALTASATKAASASTRAKRAA
jgi:phasin family protein